MTYACNYVCWKTLLFVACGHRPRIWNLWWTLCFRLTQNSFTVWSVVSGLVSGRHFLCLSLTLAGFWLFVKLSNLKLHIALLNTWGWYFFPYFQLQVHPCVVALWAAQRRCWLGKRDITLDPWAFQLPIGTQRNLRLRFCLRSTFEENCSISVAVWAFTENVDVSFVFFKADVPWIAKNQSVAGKNWYDTSCCVLSEPRLASCRPVAFETPGPSRVRFHRFSGCEWSGSRTVPGCFWWHQSWFLSVGWSTGIMTRFGRASDAVWSGAWIFCQEKTQHSGPNSVTRCHLNCPTQDIESCRSLA